MSVIVANGTAIQMKNEQPKKKTTKKVKADESDQPDNVG